MRKRYVILVYTQDRKTTWTRESEIYNLSIVFFFLVMLPLMLSSYTKDTWASKGTRKSTFTLHFPRSLKHTIFLTYFYLLLVVVMWWPLQSSRPPVLSVHPDHWCRVLVEPLLLRKNFTFSPAKYTIYTAQLLVFAFCGGSWMVSFVLL